MKARAIGSVSFSSRTGTVAAGEVFEVPDDRPALLREVRRAARRGLVEIVEKVKEVNYGEARARLENR